MSIRIRPARKDEARHIAEFYRISSDGIADYIWSRMAGAGEDVLDVGARRYAREGTPFSYENCTMVDVDGATVAMLVAFPMHVDPDAQETDPVLAPYSQLEEDGSYYICGMAVQPPYRGRGLGAALLAQAERRCRALGLSKLSLIVFERNVGAVRLYERNGYAEVRRRPVTPHPLVHYTGDALLMVKHLAPA